MIPPFFDQLDFTEKNLLPVATFESNESCAPEFYNLETKHNSDNDNDNKLIIFKFFNLRPRGR